MHLLILALLGAAAVSSQPATVINDKAAAELLMGRHLLTLQWIDEWKTAGSANVSADKGVYRIKGEQRGKGADLLTIDGVITRINAKDFTFQGRIVTRVSHIAGGRDCVRDGTFLFRITGTRKFWRMKENANPCDEAADYVDIFFARK